jgi:hypothetical protein
MANESEIFSWWGGQEIFFSCVNHPDQLWCPPQACFSMGTRAEHARTWNWHLFFILHKDVRMYRGMRWSSIYLHDVVLHKAQGQLHPTRKLCVFIIHSLRALSSWWAMLHGWYSNWLRAGRSRDQIPVGVRFSTPVQTGPGAHPTFCTKGTGSFLGVKSGWGVTLTPHPF